MKKYSIDRSPFLTLIHSQIVIIVKAGFYWQPFCYREWCGSMVSAAQVFNLLLFFSPETTEIVFSARRTLNVRKADTLPRSTNSVMYLQTRESHKQEEDRDKNVSKVTTAEKRKQEKEGWVGIREWGGWGSKL